jgi:hypothetical protein
MHHVQAHQPSIRQRDGQDLQRLQGKRQGEMIRLQREAVHLSCPACLQAPGGSAVSGDPLCCLPSRHVSAPKSFCAAPPGPPPTLSLSKVYTRRLMPLCRLNKESAYAKRAGSPTVSLRKPRPRHAMSV